MTFLAFTGLVNFVCSSTLAVVVYKKCPRREVGIAYAVLNATIASFSAFYFLWQCASDSEWGLFHLQMLTLSAMWINQALLYFNGVFFGWVPLRRKLFLLTAVGNCIFSIFNFTGIMYSAVVPRYNLGYWPDSVTWWFSAYVVFWHIELFYAIGDMLWNRNRLEGHKRDQVSYMIVAFAIGYFGGITNWPMWFGIHIPPYANILISVYTLIVGYAIVKHQLMDISIIVRKTLLYSMMSAGLAAIYAGGVAFLGRVVEDYPRVFDSFSVGVAHQHQPAALSTFIFTGLLAIFVIVKGARSPIAKSFGVYTIAISAWSFCWYKMISSTDYSQSYFWARLIHVPASFIPATFLHFVQYLLNSQANRAQTRLRKAFYVLGALFAVVCFRKTFCAAVIAKLGFRYYLEPGPYYVIFFLAFIMAIVFILSLLMLSYKNATGSKKTQIAYVIPAYVLAYVGGAAVFLPVYDVPIPSLTLYLIPLSHLIIAYAIFRHRLVDITIIIQKTLLYSVLSAGLAAVYVGTVTLLAHLLGGRHGSFSAFSSALAAIFITLLFNPLRIRTQRWIDRHFPRERLDPELLQEAAGGFAHEMKRPLSKISLPAELALMDLERVESGEISWGEVLPKVKERLRFILSQSADAGYMIEAIRALSTSSAAPFVSVDLKSLLENALRVQMDLLERHKVLVNLAFPQDRMQVSGREKQLEIVFVNLIKNAAEAMSALPPGQSKTLHISVQEEAGKAVVRVQDSGPGINPEDVGKIFQPHYTTKGSSGTGVGLYLAEQIVQTHGGMIEVVSQPGQGTLFVIRLSKILP